ncbi:MAG TPA: FixH family protein [Pseudonocardiaceae bacterium]|nr:FixH family protein [Pseudonocardiaceae bacterium]
MTRRLAYLLIALFLAAIAIFVTAPAAQAHAALVATSPADGAITAKAPGSVSATFDEAVGVSADSLQVYAPNGQRADTGGTKHGREPQQITVTLLPGLGTGTYTVGWHVVSADSHAVSGAFTFSVGAPSGTAVNPGNVGQSASQLTDIIFGVVRWGGFVSFAVLIGAVMFVICCWPVGASRPGVLRLAMGAWSGLAAATLAAVLLQGVYGAGQSMSHLFWPDVLHATFDSRYGQALGVRLLLVVVALIAFSIMLGSLPTAARRARIAAGTLWAVLTVALAGTWAVADHAGTGIQVPLAIPSDIVHLSAAAVWVGGLVTLVTIALRRARTPERAAKAAQRRHQNATVEAARAVSRFSPIALGCVVAIVATGAYQAWRGVGSLSALADTTYGRLLLLKIAATCVLIALGNLARLRVQRLQAPLEAIVATQAAVLRAAPAELAKAGAGPRAKQGRRGNHAAQPRGEPNNGTRGLDVQAQQNADRATVTLTRLRWSVTAEVVIAMAVLAVTAVLVNTPTARETYSPPVAATAAFDTGGPGGRGSIGVHVTPAKLGPNQLRVAVTGSTGQPYRPQQIQATLSQPGDGLGPLPVRLTADGPGAYRSDPVDLTITGQWQLNVTIRSDAFDETTVTMPIPIH